MEIDRNGTKPTVIQLTENMGTVHIERPAELTTNKALNKRELYRQTQNQETIITTRSG